MSRSKSSLHWSVIHYQVVFSDILACSEIGVLYFGTYHIHVPHVQRTLRRTARTRSIARASAACMQKEWMKMKTQTRGLTLVRRTCRQWRLLEAFAYHALKWQRGFDLLEPPPGPPFLNIL